MTFASVRTRLTLWNVGVLALILAGFAATLHYAATATLTQQVDLELEHTLSDHRKATNRFLIQKEREAALPLERRRHDGPPPDPPQADQKSLADGKAGKDRPLGKHPSGPPPGARPQWRIKRPATPELALRITLNSGQSLRDAFMPPGLFDLSMKPLNDFSMPKPWDQAAFARSAKGETVIETITLADTPVRLISAPVERRGQIAWVAQVIRPLDELRQLLRNLDRTLLLLILPSLIVAGFFGAFLTERSIRPVKAISRATAQLAARDLSHRLAITGADEFSELANHFNQMAERLEAAFRDLEASNQDLAAAFERQRRFTADASHELRTPLTTIKANTSLTLASDCTPEEYRQAMEETDAAANVMKRIVDDLLFLARSDTDGLTLRPETLPLAPLLDAVIAEHARAAAPPVHLEATDHPAWVRGDAHHLSRLFSNLLANAVRHTPPEGRITVTLEPKGDAVRVLVEDTGEGIPPEHLPRVFDRFYRVDTARTRRGGGAGLGLSICQGIVQAHDGAIEIASRPGEGTRVRVTLPAADPPSEQGENAVFAGAEDAGSPSQSGQGAPQSR